MIRQSEPSLMLPLGNALQGRGIRNNSGIANAVHELLQLYRVRSDVLVKEDVHGSQHILRLSCLSKP